MADNNKNNGVEERAEQIAAEAADNLRELKREAREQADVVRKDAVKLLNSAAEKIRQEVRDAKASDDVQQSVDKVATGLEKAALYLRRHSVDEVGDDMTVAVKRNPWRNLAIVFAVGVFFGLTMRNRKKSR
jgi:ElaB/YqjD/DUF883 family membrane-anchored ribosome-binding protein